MSWLLFYLLAALHPVAFIVIGYVGKTWKQRLLLWALLPLPAIWYCWGYYAIRIEHAQMCAADGGLRVLIQPDRTDRVRLVGEDIGRTATSTLQTYYPRIQFVEAITENRSETGKRLVYYDAYTATPNPRAGQPMAKHPWKEPNYVIAKARVASLAPTMFEISVQESNIPHGMKTETYLSRGNKVYAKHTDLVHWWTGIQYPDALPTWRCPDTNKPSPPRNDPHAPQEKWVYPQHGFNMLIELITN